jgi:3-phosphoshikimate 1-carboxyvinyltransferase
MLPDAIQLHPLETNQPITVGIPGSKSITNRALILAALTKGPTEIKGALWSEDTQVMTQCLQKLGFEIQIAQDPADNCNRTLTIQGQAGQIPGGGSTDSPMELYVGNAGTAARFLMAMLCLGSGVYRLSGVERMHERPQSELIASLRELGYVIETPNDRLPAIIHGRGPRPGASAQASIGQSSQFASALLLSAKVGQWEINLTEGSAEVAPYVQMTQQMVEAFAQRTSSTYQVEPDSSSGSYFWAMGYLLENHAPKVAGEIKIAQWPTTDWQIDTRFPHHLPLPQTLSRERDLGDSIMTAMVLAPWAAQPTCFTDLGRLRLQECERVNAMQRELIKCGVKVEQLGDTLVIEPGVVHGARIDTYNDHRMAMCFSVMGVLVPDMVINKPECVKKTFPNFYQKLASAPPLGLGMTITQPGSSLALSEDLLFA